MGVIGYDDECVGVKGYKGWSGVEVNEYEGEVGRGERVVWICFLVSCLYGLLSELPKIVQKAHKQQNSNSKEQSRSAEKVFIVEKGSST